MFGSFFIRMLVALYASSASRLHNLLISHLMCAQEDTRCQPQRLAWHRLPVYNKNLNHNASGSYRKGTRGRIYKFDPGEGMEGSATLSRKAQQPGFCHFFFGTGRQVFPGNLSQSIGKVYHCRWPSGSFSDLVSYRADFSKFRRQLILLNAPNFTGTPSSFTTWSKGLDDPSSNQATRTGHRRLEAKFQRLKAWTPCMSAFDDSKSYSTQAAVGQISLTMDIWSDHNHQSYLAITAHWIAMIPGTTALELKAALIAFHWLRGHHDGESLADIVLQLLDRAGITGKVWYLFFYHAFLIYFQGWAFHVG